MFNKYRFPIMAKYYHGNLSFNSLIHSFLFAVEITEHLHVKQKASKSCINICHRKYETRHFRKIYEIRRTPQLFSSTCRPAILNNLTMASLISKSAGLAHHQNNL